MSSRYVRVDRGSGSRAGQLLQHRDDPKRWQVRVFLGRVGAGRKRYHSEIVHGRKRDAEARLIELLGSKNQGRLSPRNQGRLTLRDAAREWLKSKRHEVTPRTLASYRNALELYALPVLGSQRLHTLTLHHATRLYDDMRSGTLPTEAQAAGWRGEALSARSVQIAHTALSQVLAFAVMNEWINRNPLSEARGVAPAARARAKFALNVQQRQAYLDAAAAQGAFYRALYRVLMDTGLRPGEACALTWRDLDFQAGRIKVTTAVTRGADGKAIIAPPKTAKSRRTLPMFGLEPVLLEHHAWQVERGLNAAGYVFTNQDGELVKPWAFNKRELERVTLAAGITEHVTLYCFRHTFATLHLASGTPLKVVSDWLGHSTIRQTADTYQHASTEVFLDYAERHTQWLAAASSEGKGVAPN